MANRRYPAALLLLLPALTAAQTDTRVDLATCPTAAPWRWARRWRASGCG
ncbi:hypothetical protein AABD60_10445 [Edwardsiella piscicida]